MKQGFPMMSIPLPARLTLTDTNGFILNAAKQGENEAFMAAKIVAQPSIVAHKVFYDSGLPVYDTGVSWGQPGHTIGIRQDELCYFSIQPLVK